ncbi:MAG: class I SAM-dependent methyltransferase [Opitutales bacterium]|jgi:2-polyprenyl-3-methyl-5-hydroxy-6-metoxy-1,4-benzoquinol methylase
MNYRERYYARYASVVKGVIAAPTPAEADYEVAPRDTTLRGWLPADKQAAILDLACGHGLLLWFFARRGYGNVEGVDISAEQVALARQLHPKVECANGLEFLRAKAGHYDLILAMDIIEHLTKDEALDFLAGAWAALKPGGRLVVQTPNAASPMRGEIYHGDFTHEVCYAPRMLGKVMTLSGFENYEAREIPPYARGLKSAVRGLLWKLLRLKIVVSNYIETGEPGGGVYTRVFLASAIRPR